MGCRCNEREAAIKRIVAIAQSPGDVARELKFIGRTLVEDTRSGALQREAVRRLGLLRAGTRR